MNKKRIIISALTGTIALAALSISLTLAWYGAKDRLSVENLEVGVYTKGNLKISTSSDIESFVEDLEDKEEIEFTPVSTMHKDKWMDQKANTPIFYESAYKHVLSNGEPYLEEADFGFYRKEIYLLTTIRNQFAVLDFDKENEGEERKGCLLERDDLIYHAKNQERAEKLHQENPGWGLSVDQIKERLDNLVDSLRISILVNDGKTYQYYIIDPTKDESNVTYLGGRLDNDRNGYYDTYKDGSNNSKEIIYGEVNDRDLIKYNNPVSTNTADNNLVISDDPFFGNSFNGQSKPTAYTYNEDLSKANGFEIATEQSLSLADLKNDESNMLIPLESGVPTKIILSIYLEGWDKDCINATMGASFNTKLSFKLKGGNV